MASSLASLTALVESQQAEQARLASSLSALVDQTRRKDEAQIKYIQSLEQRLAGFERALGDLSLATDDGAGGGLGDSANPGGQGGMGRELGLGGGGLGALARSGSRSPASTVQASGRSSPASAYSNRRASSPSRPTSPLSPASMASMVASVGSGGGSCSPATNAAESNRRLMTMARLGDPTQQDQLRAMQASARDVELVAGENTILQSRLVQQARASEKRIGAMQHRLAQARDENLELRGAVSRWSQESRMIKDDFAIHVGNEAVAAAVQDASIGGRGQMAAGGFSSSSSSSSAAAAAARESPPSRFDQAARRRKLRYGTTAANGARGGERKGRSAFSSARGVGRLDVSPDRERDCDDDLSSARLYSFDGGGGFDDDDYDDGIRSEGVSQVLGHASVIASVGAEERSDDYEGVLNPDNGGRVGRVFDSADLTRLRQDAKARRSARQELRHFAEIDF